MWRYLLAGLIMLNSMVSLAAIGQQSWFRDHAPQPPTKSSPIQKAVVVQPPIVQAPIVQPPTVEPRKVPEPPRVTEPEMVLIVGGLFPMGSHDDPSEQPVHQVSVKSFFLAKYPVTVRQWRDCVRFNGCDAVPKGDDDAVMGNLSWDDAQQYVTWLAQVSHIPYRLPSEAEWEYAARGGTVTRYWWGNTMKPGLAICKGCGEAVRPERVGLRPSNPFGLFDINGGIAEWVQDCWVKDYRSAPADGTPRSNSDCSDHVLRGGAWNNDEKYVRPASRTFYDGSVRYPTHGLRVAVTFM
jgi:formylglycine-generating enzyme required for sulfatase activity